jgi:L-ascorbate metabolism protein UlaG (beta-lactamase superfamily)
MPTITWLGHNAWSIETAEHTVLIDPFLDDSPTAPVRAEDVKADFILVSHGHFDHVSDVTKISKRTGAKVIANYEVCEWLQQQGVKETDPMNIGGSTMQPFGRVKLTPAIHSSAMPDGAYGGEPGGFLLELPDARIYFACDTALFTDMKLIAVGGLDLAVLPIGDRYTMGPDDSIIAIDLLQPRRVAPSHFNTWPPIAQDVHAWAHRVRIETHAIPMIVEPGGRFSLDG